LRTSAQRNRRKTVYRALSVAFILIGLVHLGIALSQGDIHDGAFPTKVDTALLWFLFAGTWVALSRIWGELAEMNATSKQDAGPTS
jgi:hypothetical protein